MVRKRLGGPFPFETASLGGFPQPPELVSARNSRFGGDKAAKRGIVALAFGKLVG